MPRNGFVIRSQLTGLVLDVPEGKITPGVGTTRGIQLYQEHRNSNQIWYLDVVHQHISSQLDPQYVLDIGAGDSVVLSLLDDTSRTQKWQIRGEFLHNMSNNHVVDILGEESDQGALVVVCQRNGRASQKWKFDNQFSSHTSIHTVQSGSPIFKKRSTANQPNDQTKDPKSQVCTLQPPAYTALSLTPPSYKSCTTGEGDHVVLSHATTVPGRYFHIRSVATGLVLELEKRRLHPTPRVILTQPHGKDTQLWYTDPVRGVIRCRADDHLVLDVGRGGHFCMSKHKNGSVTQKWTADNNRLSSAPSGLVASVAQQGKNCVVLAQRSNDSADSQLWHFDYQPMQPFQIVSKMNNKVLDLQFVQDKCSTLSTRATVTMYRSTGQDNQLWWEDKQGHIRAKLNHLVLNMTPDGTLEAVDMQDDMRATFWVKNGDYIENRYDSSQCVDISQCNTKDRAAVICWHKNEGNNQKWCFRYATATPSAYQAEYCKPAALKQTHVTGRVQDV